MPTNPDQLYELLPVIYRMRDAEQGYPLQALLRVIGEQVQLIQDDIAQLYDNWFIETADDWAVPYIAALIGYRPVHEAGEPSDVTKAGGAARNKILIPRREVANTLHYRRRKGARALLETLAYDVAGWSAHAVEFYRLLGRTQNINHLYPERGRTVDVRDGNALVRLDGPFDRIAHTVDVRRPNSIRTRGRYDIPSVGVFVWRLKAYPVLECPANAYEAAGRQSYTFSILGNDAPLFTKPMSASAPGDCGDELRVPAPITRRALQELHPCDVPRPEMPLDATEPRPTRQAASAAFYGADKSFEIIAPRWSARHGDGPVPAEFIIPADLTDWQYYPPLDYIAVDPERGRMTFPPSQLPKKGVRVSYHYGFSADMGGGMYDRGLTQAVSSRFYRVGENERYSTISDALGQWDRDKPRYAVIEIVDSGVYVEPLAISLGENQTLQLRAANFTRPVIRLLDWQTSLPDALTIEVDHGSRFVLDGLLVTGRALHIRGTNGTTVEGTTSAPPPAPCDDDCPAHVLIRHCTLVPGWSLQNDCKPQHELEPSIEVINVNARLGIEHSIVGAIEVTLDQVKNEPIPVEIRDSILDSTVSTREAFGAPGKPVAHARLTCVNSTVFGTVQVHAIELAENSIFNDCVNVARRQLGCMRFCYVPSGCRTPRRYRCQPDLVVGQVQAKYAAEPSKRDALIELERARVEPVFTDRQYGRPGYCQLAESCASEIKRGADDESEMGAFHDLFQPQREANLRARLDEYTPAGADVGIFFVT